MIVSSVQNDYGVQVAHIAENGQIGIKTLPTKYSKYEKCLPSDPSRSLTHKNYLDGSPIRRVTSHRFGALELREFLMYDIKESERDAILAYNIPNVYSVDIEVDMSPPDVLRQKNVHIPSCVTSDTQLMGFPDPELAYRPIESISITAPDMGTVVLSTSGNRIEEGDDKIIEDWLNEYFKEKQIPNEIIKDFTKNNKIKYTHRVFKNEGELIRAYLELQKNVMHTICGWNWTYFDAMYIQKRCEYLDINMAIASPIMKVDKRTGVPMFRFEFDAMTWCDKFGAYDKSAKGLGYVANKLLEIGKVSYDGSFIDLYNGDYKKFLFYNAVDTILVQMIVQKFNIMSTPLTLSYYAKIPINSALSVTAIADAMWFDELYHNGIFNANPFDSESAESADYEGGYVLDPRRKLSDFIAIMDYGALYPRSIETLNCSPDAIVGHIDLKNQKEFLLAKNKGYTISMNGTLYKNDGDNTLKVIISRHLDERYYFKGLKFDIEQNILPPIFEELKRRGLK